VVGTVRECCQCTRLKVGDRIWGDLADSRALNEGRGAFAGERLRSTNIYRVHATS
jgi:hypothetical protein